MSRVRLSCAQKRRLQVQVKSMRLQRLRTKPQRNVIATNAFTGEICNVQATCVEELRSALEKNFLFTNVRLYHMDRELADVSELASEVNKRAQGKLLRNYLLWRSVGVYPLGYGLMMMYRVLYRSLSHSVIWTVHLYTPMLYFIS